MYFYAIGIRVGQACIQPSFGSNYDANLHKLNPCRDAAFWSSLAILQLFMCRTIVPPMKQNVATLSEKTKVLLCLLFNRTTSISVPLYLSRTAVLNLS